MVLSVSGSDANSAYYYNEDAAGYHGCKHDLVCIDHSQEVIAFRKRSQNKQCDSYCL